VRKRPAYSLVEVMVVIALTGVVASIAAVCLHGLYRVDRGVRKDIERRRSTVRLSVQFRSDAHLALEAAVNVGSGETQAIVFTQLPDRSIEYRVESNGISRIVRQSQRIVHQDVFRLPGVREIRLETNASTPKRAVIVICRKTPASGDPKDGYREQITATVGLGLMPQESKEDPGL